MMIQHNTLPAAADRTHLHTFLLCCGLIGAALFSLVNFTLSAISPNYDIARQSIVDLEFGKYGWIQSVNFLVAGMFLCAFAWGLRKELVKGTGAIAIPALQIVLGLAMALQGVFTGYNIHALLILITFASIMVSFFIFSRRFAADERWAHWAVYTNITAVILLVFFALYIWSEMHHGHYTGIYQRGVLLTRVIWNLFFTTRLLAGIRLDPAVK